MSNLNQSSADTFSQDENVENTIERYVDLADRRVAEFEQVLSRVIDRVENISQTLGRIFARGKEQTEQLSELKTKAEDTIAPVMNRVSPVVSGGADFSRQLASSARANPKPFAIGAGLVAGGLLVVAYYLKKHEEAGGFSSEYDASSETWRTDNSSEFVQNGVANAS